METHFPLMLQSYFLSVLLLPLVQSSIIRPKYIHGRAAFAASLATMFSLFHLPLYQNKQKKEM